MATLNLTRGQFQKEHANAGAASGANTYVLDDNSRGVIIKAEGTGASGSVVLKLRWLSNDGTARQIIQTFTMTAIADTTGVSEATGGYNHTVGPSNGLAIFDRMGMKNVKVDIVSFTTLTAASVWISAY